jgi:methionine synthase II (cobalamin-independent)
MEITKEITIEELTEEYAFSVNYLSKKGIRCIVCGEPIWGTLEEACEEKGFSPEDIALVVEELNELKSQDNPEEYMQRFNFKKI